MIKQFTLGSAWISTIAFVCFGDILFHDQEFGLNLGLFFLCLSGLTLPFFRKDRKSLTRWVFITVLPISILIDPTTLNVTFFTLMFVLNMYSRGVENFSVSLFMVLKTFFIYLYKASVTLLNDMKITFKLMTDRSTIKTYLIKSTKNWLIAFLVSHIFLCLFYSANPIIENSLDDFFSYLVKSLLNFSLLKHAKRSLLWLVLFFTAWSVCRTYITSSNPEKEKTSQDRVSLDLIIKLLICFNLVFAVQTILDLYFLLGNGHLPKGLTYATYAHKGAYPLILVTLLSGLFICFVFQEGLSAQKNRLARGLVFLWLIQNIMLALFTLQRLSMYVSLYHLTRWRYATAIWILLIISGFIFTFIRISCQKSNAWYLRQNLTVTFLVLFLCCFIKSDSIIAYYNITHCFEYSGTGSKLDKEYIESLGISSMPAIQFALNEKPNQMTSLLKTKENITNKYINQDAKHWQEISVYENHLVSKFLKEKPK